MDRGTARRDPGLWAKLLEGRARLTGGSRGVGEVHGTAGVGRGGVEARPGNSGGGGRRG